MERSTETETEEETVFRSQLPAIGIPEHLPLHSYVLEHVSDSELWSRPCIIHGPTGDTYSYGEVELTSRRVAAALHSALGIRKGDVIMLCLQNCPEFVFSFLAASRLCAVSTTVSPICTPAEIHKQARASAARVIFTMAAFAHKVTGYAAQNAVQVVIVDGEAPQGCIAFQELASADEKGVPADVQISPDDVVALPYSSGTTGLPKGVMLTHKGLVTSVAQLVDGENPNLYFHSKDVILCLLGMVHIYALNSVMLCALRVGATLLIMPRFEVKALLELVQQHKVTIAPFVPPIILSLLNYPDISSYDLSSIRLVVSGGAPMAKQLQDAIQPIFPNAVFGQGYGMTEAGSVSMSMGFAKKGMKTKPGACGSAIRNAELKVVDPNTGASLPKNKPGEFCIRGAQIMKGYLNDPEATQNTIDGQGWLHTGDIGFIDDDGELFIVGRLKELIKYKGYQVAPAELEALLINHPHVADAAVVGMKDDAAGEVPVAFIVKSSGTQITEDDIKLYIFEQVVFYKRIKRVFFVDTIPKLASGKILRKELETRLAKCMTNSEQEIPPFSFK